MTTPHQRCNLNQYQHRSCFISMFIKLPHFSHVAEFKGSVFCLVDHEHGTGFAGSTLMPGNFWLVYHFNAAGPEFVVPLATETREHPKNSIVRVAIYNNRKSKIFWRAKPAKRAQEGLQNTASSGRNREDEMTIFPFLHSDWLSKVAHPKQFRLFPKWIVWM